MNRYEAKEDQANHLWYVNDAEGLRLPHVGMIGVYEDGAELSKAEACIITFALNAVAEGHELTYTTDRASGLAGQYAAYDGPTDGIAPVAGTKE